jgi:hypothetical protein
MYEADGLLHYFTIKSVPIGNITACAADAANPGQRTNTDPNGEERYTFTLSAERDCDGNVAVNLTTTSIQAWPPLYHRHSQHLPARTCQAPLLGARITCICSCIYLYTYLKIDTDTTYKCIRYRYRYIYIYI